MIITKNPTPWSPTEMSRAADLFAAEMVKGTLRQHACAVIARAIGRTFQSVQSRLHRFGPQFQGKDRYPGRYHDKTPRKAMPFANVVKVEAADERVIAERDARVALMPTSVTAALMGDPLPGRSALDRRNASSV